MERSTRKFLAWSVVVKRTKAAFEALVKRTKAAFEALVDAAPPAKQYYSDAFPVWAASWYPGEYEALTNKSQTFSVEGGNADLRHYVARLARKNRCFSRCPNALFRAVDLFVRAWNARQDFKRRYPKLPANVIDFIPI